MIVRNILLATDLGNCFNRLPCYMILQTVAGFQFVTLQAQLHLQLHAALAPTMPDF